MYYIGAAVAVTSGCTSYWGGVGVGAEGVKGLYLRHGSLLIPAMWERVQLSRCTLCDVMCDVVVALTYSSWAILRSEKSSGPPSLHTMKLKSLVGKQ